MEMLQQLAEKYDLKIVALLAWTSADGHWFVII